MTGKHNPYEQHPCPECGVLEGELHKWDCAVEECPFCGGQLVGCDCNCNGIVSTSLKEVLLQDGSMAGNHLYARVPWIEYPAICAKCGAMWPETFVVTDDEWHRYVPGREQTGTLCRRCYDHIKGLIDADTGHDN